MKRFYIITTPILLYLLICCRHKPKESTISPEQDGQSMSQVDSSKNSECIDQKIEQFKVRYKDSRSMSQIFKFEGVDGNTYYFFDEGMAMDLPAYVLNNSCDTICLTGGFRRGPQSEDLPKCPEEKEGSRKQIWN